MAGGGGTRLWPVSRQSKPKQLLPFIGDKTLLQATYERLAKGFNQEDIYISTNVNQKEAILQQLPEFPVDQLILEPEKRDTAPAIGLVAVSLMQRDPEVDFVTINSDAYVKDEDEYLRLLKLAEQIIRKHPQKTLLLGLKPTYPETGYGYIKMSGQFDKIKNNNGFDEIFEVERFVEKPNLETAKSYVSKWQYLWNPAVFVWNAKNLMNLFATHLPQHHTVLRDLAMNYSNQEYVSKRFLDMDPISIDYGIMEKLTDMLVIPADFGWADIGHWRTVKDVLSNEEDNLVKGNYCHEDSAGNLIYNYTDKMVCTVGIKDMIVIQTDDVLFMCPKDRAHDVKKIIEQLKSSKFQNLL
jgi:mannose-1-phosphate guanylyltransferase